MKQPVDVVMLSYTKDRQIYEMTRYCLKTLHVSEPDVEFRVNLVETSHTLAEDGFSYDDLVAKVTTYDEPFNYNRYLNLSLPECETDFVVVSNNDVLFHPQWFSHAHWAMNVYDLDSASPRCPAWKEHVKMGHTVVEGFTAALHFCGWNLVFRRSTLMEMLPLDEAFSFWFQDNDLALRLYRAGKKHALIGDSLVTHLESQSHRLFEDEDLYKHTHGLWQTFDNKWNH